MGSGCNVIHNFDVVAMLCWNNAFWLVKTVMTLNIQSEGFISAKRNEEKLVEESDPEYGQYLAGNVD